MPVRIVQLDPDWFGDIEAETDCFEAAWDDVVVAIDCVGENFLTALGRPIFSSHTTPT